MEQYNGAYTGEQIDTAVRKVLSTKPFFDVAIDKTSYAADATYEEFPFRAAIALAGVTSDMLPTDVVYHPTQSLSGEHAPVAECYDGGIYLYATKVPDANFTILTIVCQEV